AASDVYKRQVYDSANDVMLMFQGDRSDPVRVWVYHLRENRWEQLPVVYPAPRYGTFDVAYDAHNNVVVISGGWSSARSGETTIRETWTYRYRPATKKPPEGPGRPRDLRVTTEPGGKAVLVWASPTDMTPKQFRVERGVGTRIWEVQWTAVATVNGNQTTCTDTNPPSNRPCFYRIVPLDETGKPGLPSTPRAAVPPAPRWAEAVATTGGVHLTWEASRSEDVLGYHVYRAPVAAVSYWAKPFDPLELADKFRRITKEPVKETEFSDREAVVRETTCEFAWPDSFAYIVRPVNAWGLEGGASPTTLALPGPPGPVRVIPWLDGRRLILWPASRAGSLRGYWLMRMDDWNGAYVFRWHAAPLMAHGFWDDVEFPTADRRKYFVSGVDTLGAVGIPSSDVWSHGFP
ncbi:MAG: hypothetical protein N2255_05430, partial [Kiritimatiellae bacterium]|nr:hypothetical protein [Kiritimatiellia bacterium]